MLIWLMFLAAVGFLMGLARAFRGALEVVSPSERPDILMVQGLTLMVVCGIIFGCVCSKVM